jgi:hypothetical protein
MTATRPSYYPYHDVLENNIVLPEDSLFIFSGYPQGLPVPSADHNGKFNSNYKWASYLDQGTLRNDDWLSSVNIALTTTPLTYDNGGNVTTTGATVNTYATYLLNNTRIEIDDAALNGVGAAINGSPLIMPGAITPGRIWVYVSSSGVTRYEAVAAGVADSPGGSEITLVGLDINGLGVVTDGAVVPVTLPLPVKPLTIAVPIVADSTFAVKGNTTLGDNVADTTTISGPTTIGSTLGVTGATTLASVAVTGTTTCNGNVNLGNAAVDTLTTAATSIFNASATFNSTVTVATGDVFSSLGDTVIGTDAASILSINASTTVEAVSTINALMSFIAAGPLSGGIVSDATAILSWLGLASFSGRVALLGAPVVAGDIGQDGSSNLQWKDATATKYVHANSSGWVQGYGLDTTEALAATITVQTGTQIAPLTASSVEVRARAYVQRAVAGDVVISLIAVGDGTIGATRTIWIPYTAGTTWFPIHLTRTYSANTTARHYQFLIDGNGQNVEGAEMTIEVVPAS